MVYLTTSFEPGAAFAVGAIADEDDTEKTGQ